MNQNINPFLAIMAESLRNESSSDESVTNESQIFGIDIDFVVNAQILELDQKIQELGLTAEQDKEIKKRRRMAKNRMAAANSRRKRFAKTNDLLRKCKKAEEEIKRLDKEWSSGKLVEERKVWEEFVGKVEAEFRSALKNKGKTDDEINKILESESTDESLSEAS